MPFDGNGSPVAPSNSTTAAIDVVSNSDLSACPDGCFRPVGLAWDARGRLYMSSDSTGEIYVVTKEDGSGVADVSRVGGEGQASSPTSSGGGSSSGTQSSAVSGLRVRGSVYVAVWALVVGAVV